MSKKIIAIGGGNIGECENNIIKPYETEIFDREIISISDLSRPNILFIGLADPINMNNYFYYFENVFTKLYNCKCKMLELSDLNNKQKLDDLFNWSDVIYIGGGNVFTLINICKKYEVEVNLIKAYEDGKVMCGNSAGGICWFKYGNTVNPINKGKLIKQECFGFKNMVFAPHCDEINGHFENVENLIFDDNLVAISLSNCVAIEIIDDKFRFISSSFDRYKIQPFGIRSFWDKGEYVMENIELTTNYNDLETLLKPEIMYSSEVRADVKRLLKKRNIYFK